MRILNWFPTVTFFFTESGVTMCWLYTQLNSLHLNKPSTSSCTWNIIVTKHHTHLHRITNHKILIWLIVKRNGHGTCIEFGMKKIFFWKIFYFFYWHLIKMTNRKLWTWMKFQPKFIPRFSMSNFFSLFHQRI